MAGDFLRVTKVGKSFKLIKESNVKIFNSLTSKSFFGTGENGSFFFNSFETLHLIKLNKIKAYDNDIELTEEDLIKLYSRRDKLFFEKFLVFSHLRCLGYFLRPALKYGSDFLVYDKKSDFKNEHSKWLLRVFSPSNNLKASDYSLLNRVSHSVKKSLLLGFVDSNFDITFFESNWVKL